MLVIVKHQNRLSLQRFYQLQERLDLARMNFMNPPVLIVNGSVCKLQKLIAECCGARDADIFFIFRKLQYHLPLQLPVCLQGFRIQLHRNLVVDNIRQLQIIFRLHADADVCDFIQHSLLCSRLGLIAVHHAVSSAFIRLKVSLPELCVSFAQAFPAIQKIYLRPQVIQTIR